MIFYIHNFIADFMFSRFRIPNRHESANHSVDVKANLFARKPSQVRTHHRATGRRQGGHEGALHLVACNGKGRIEDFLQDKPFQSVKKKVSNEMAEEGSRL